MKKPIPHSADERVLLIRALENFMNCRAPDGKGGFIKCAPNDSDFEFALNVIPKEERKAQDGKN